MRRAVWKDYQVIEAITLLAEAEIGLEEQAQLNGLLDRPHIPAKEGLRDRAQTWPRQYRRSASASTPCMAVRTPASSPWP